MIGIKRGTRKHDTGYTVMNQMQPLDVIGGNNKKPEEPESYIFSEEDFNPGYTEICMDCQIFKITDSCKQCGLYQYGNLFDIMTRRKDNHGVSTK